MSFAMIRPVSVRDVRAAATLTIATAAGAWVSQLSPNPVLSAVLTLGAQGIASYVLRVGERKVLRGWERRHPAQRHHTYPRPMPGHRSRLGRPASRVELAPGRRRTIIGGAWGSPDGNAQLRAHLGPTPSAAVARRPRPSRAMTF